MWGLQQSRLRPRPWVRWTRRTQRTRSTWQKLWHRRNPQMLVNLSHHWTQPTLESSETATIVSANPPAVSVLSAPLTAKTMFTHKFLTIPESRLWHRRLTHMDATTMKTQLGGYTHADSMYTICIQAKHKQRFIRVPVKHTMKPFEVVLSDICGLFSTPDFVDNWYYLLLINDYARYISTWLLPIQTAKTCTSSLQSVQARVDSMGYEMNWIGCDNGRGEYDGKILQYLLAVRSTTYERSPWFAHYPNCVADWMIRTITEKACAMRIESQAPIQFWAEAGNTTVYFHQRSPNEGLIRNHCNGNKALYKKPYTMLHRWGQPTHDANSN